MSAPNSFEVLYLLPTHHQTPNSRGHLSLDPFHLPSSPLQRLPITRLPVTSQASTVAHHTISRPAPIRQSRNPPSR
ncbi:unnamed protein product, partial [Sphenostylis stenocarpa]